jgi:ABC-type branched-subunit amino acid transport system substrate-binding protein
MHFDWQDNGGSPQAAVSIMQQQYLKSPDIYVSGVKPQTAAIADQISARGTPHFEWVFDAFINAKAHNNLRTWLSFKIEPDIFLKYAQLRQAKRVAVAYVQLPNTQEEYLQFVIPGLKKQGIQDKGIFVEAYPIATQDFKTLAVKIRDFHPDLIILNGFQDNLVGLVRALRALSAITDGNTIASYDMLDAAQVLGSDEIEGIRAAAPIFATRPDRPCHRNPR